MATQGLSMLESVARHIESGGFIVYSTCSVLREENEDVIARFLDSPTGKEFHPQENPFRSTLTLGSPDAHFAIKLIKA